MPTSHRLFSELAVLYIILTVLLTYTSPVTAEQMDSSNYQLQIESVEIQPATDSASTAEPTIPITPTPHTLPPANLAELKQQGYTILSGKDDQYAAQHFTIAISQTSITFENTPNQSTQQKDLDISVSSEGTYGYQIIASQPSILTTMTGLTIKNTTCDSPQYSCSVNNAASWESDTSYGFGYTIKGNDTPRDFNNSTYFRPFSAERDITIMSESMTEKVRTATVTMRLKTQAGQPEGSYHTTVQLLALPKM